MEILDCPKCGEHNARVYVIDTAKRWKVGKCHNINCGFWGKLQKLEAVPEKEGKKVRSKKAGSPHTQSQAATAPGGSPVVERSPAPTRPEPERGPIPYQPEPGAKRWWDKDIFELVGELFDGPAQS